VTDNEEELMTELTLADMPESDTKAMLVEMSKADTNNSFQALSDRFDVIDMIATSGWTGPITFEQREAIIQSVVLNEMIYKKRVAIAQIREGLSILDILKITQDNPATMKPLFVSDDSPLTLKRCFAFIYATISLIFCCLIRSREYPQTSAAIDS
jgi:hypothetical protein